MQVSDQENGMNASAAGIPYEQQNLHKGHQYIKDGNILSPYPSSVNPVDLPGSKQVVTVLDKQMGRLILEWDFSWVTKSRVGARCVEAEAMRLVFSHTDVPVPEVLFTDCSEAEEEPDPGNSFKPDFRPPEEMIGMTIIPGKPPDAEMGYARRRSQRVNLSSTMERDLEDPRYLSSPRGRGRAVSMSC